MGSWNQHDLAQRCMLELRGVKANPHISQPEARNTNNIARCNKAQPTVLVRLSGSSYRRSSGPSAHFRSPSARGLVEYLDVGHYLLAGPGDPLLALPSEARGK